MCAHEEYWASAGLPSGLLTDEDILTLCNQGLLITENFEQDQVHQTCYELRVGTTAYFLLREETDRKCDVDDQHPILMRPGDIVTIITYEEVQLPDNVMGRIISKGHLFSIGLSPVITFVDPGFSGNLGITFINHSKRVIELKYQDSISKIEFEKLGKNVNEPYRGQHNFADSIWPIDYGKIKSRRNLTLENIKDNDFMKEEANFYGEPFDLITQSIIDTKNVMNKKFTQYTTVLLGIIVFVSLSIILNNSEILPEDAKKDFVSFFLSLITVIIKYLFDKMQKNI